MATDKKVALVIMDGWAHGKKDQTDAISQARTPFVESLYEKYPNEELKTFGETVGLPAGQMGNSEVGHLNIGAGRPVLQDFLKINKVIEKGEMAGNDELQAALEYAASHEKKVHLMGLVSDGGVHAHIDHLKALVDIAEQKGLPNVFIHAFTDGRDTDPKSGMGFIEDLLGHIKGKGARLASLTGRYYAMDRDRRWERTAKAYELMVNGKGIPAREIQQAMQESYDQGVTDEFIQPVVVVDDNQNPVATIKDGDVIICFNFRTDRCRQIIKVLTQKSFPEYGMTTMNIYTVTMTRYDRTFEGVHVIFDKEDVHQTLGEVIAGAGKTQLRIAETEKYPHVTFFFSGGREVKFDGEQRIMVNSPKVATYDLQPEMSGYEVTEKVLRSMDTDRPDFICLNYANADMVAHTGDFEAAIKAVETVDHCVRKVVEKGLELGYTIILTSDHGNADYMVNEDGSPNTAHTKNPVPVFLIEDPVVHQISGGTLCNIAPTILSLMDIDKPAEMTCDSLIKERS